MTSACHYRAWLAAALASAAALVLAIGVFTPSPARAHPLDNFSVNTYSGFDLYADAIRIRYIVDMAELPAYLERANRIDANGDGEVTAAESLAYLESTGPALLEGLSLSANGRSAALRILGSSIDYPQGEGGLFLARIVFVLEASIAPGQTTLEWANGNFADRPGWHEIVVRAADGVPLASSTASSTGRSRELTAYPDRILADAPADRAATVVYTAGTGASAPAVGAVSAAYTGQSAPGAQVAPAPAGAAPPRTPSDPFVSLIAHDHITLPVLALLLLTAIAFGAIHALEPGHGKTIVAGYFVVARGTARQAVLLGLAIGVTHSLGVLAIGMVTLYGSRYFLPEDIYPWLSLVSGLLVLALGTWLLLSRASGLPSLRRLLNFHFHLGPLSRHAHEHEHGHIHSHPHPPAPGHCYRQDAWHGHDHQTPGGTAARAATPGAPPWKALITLGLIDGMVPTPSTIVVLVGAVALDRVALGIGLIVAFSFGLALVLTAASLSALYMPRLLVWLRSPQGPASRYRVLRRIAAKEGAESRLVRYLPVGGAAVFLSMGIYLTLRAAADPTILG